MPSALKRLHSATGSVALVIALLALVASAAGVGYAAGQIGTNDIKNNAVTTPKIKNNAVKTKKIKNNAVTAKKIKNGTITAADMVANEAQKAATLLNGGEGDCVYQSATVLLPGIDGVTYRKDRFGEVHLTGVVVGTDGPGGDGVCNYSDPGQISDAIAFILPAGYIPAKTHIANSAGGDLLLIVGAQGFVTPGGVLPPGAVADNSPSTGGNTLVLNGISFEPAGSNVVIPKMKASGRAVGDLLGLGS
ncbi:hypothetical protein [Nocardioides dilutus]